jgi:undecaprenyl-diphosphatase
MAEIIFLSIIQGVTEFLPISSSAHLILFSNYFNFNNQSLTLDVSLHLGSLLAIIFYFKKDLLDMANNKNLFLKILISSIPVVVFGFCLIKLDLINYLRSYEIIGWTTIIFGVLLYFSDLKKTKKKISKDFKYSTAVFIGLFQVLSLVPGVSRSGITITGSRFFNFSRLDSAKISFLISIPTLAVISLYNLQILIMEKNFEVSKINFIGIILSFLFSYLTIKYFLNYIKKFSLTVFVFYRIFLGTIILIYVY